jgi:hypothetical protein
MDQSFRFMEWIPIFVLHPVGSNKTARDLEDWFGVVILPNIEERF